MDNIKEEVIDDMENLRKKNEIEIQNTMQGHSSRLEQAEDRISDFKMKWKLNEKLKQFKTCESTTQELTNSIKTQI
jgi:hypothetical protein